MCRSPYRLKIKRAACGLLTIAGIVMLLCACNREPMQKKTTSPAPTEVMIKFKPGVPEDSVRALADRLGLEQVREIRELNVRVFRITSRVSAEQVLRAAQSNAHIEYAEPNSKVKIPEKN